MVGNQPSNRDSMHSNLDVLLPIHDLIRSLPGETKHQLSIFSVLARTWLSARQAVASVVPQHDIDAVVQVEVRPLRIINLALREAKVGVADDHRAGSVDVVAESLEVLMSGWQEENVYLVAVGGLQKLVFSPVHSFHVSCHVSQGPHHLGVHHLFELVGL